MSKTIVTIEEYRFGPFTRTNVREGQPVEGHYARLRGRADDGRMVAAVAWDEGARALDRALGQLTPTGIQVSDMRFAVEMTGEEKLTTRRDQRGKERVFHIDRENGFTILTGPAQELHRSRVSGSIVHAAAAEMAASGDLQGAFDKLQEFVGRFARVVSEDTVELEASAPEPTAGTADTTERNDDIGEPSLPEATVPTVVAAAVSDSASIEQVAVQVDEEIEPVPAPISAEETPIKAEDASVPVSVAEVPVPVSVDEVPVAVEATGVAASLDEPAVSVSVDDATTPAVVDEVSVPADADHAVVQTVFVENAAPELAPVDEIVSSASVEPDPADEIEPPVEATPAEEPPTVVADVAADEPVAVDPVPETVTAVAPEPVVESVVVPQEPVAVSRPVVPATVTRRSSMATRQVIEQEVEAELPDESPETAAARDFGNAPTPTLAASGPVAPQAAVAQAPVVTRRPTSMTTGVPPQSAVKPAAPTAAVSAPVARPVGMMSRPASAFSRPGQATRTAPAAQAVAPPARTHPGASGQVNSTPAPAQASTPDPVQAVDAATLTQPVRTTSMGLRPRAFGGGGFRPR